MRVLTIAEAAAFAASAREAGRRVVFTNGVFDLLHPGHVRYLAAARAIGDMLVVGVKGADWAEDAIVGRDTVESRGGRVVRMPIAKGWSTSAILEKMKRIGH